MQSYHGSSRWEIDSTRSIDAVQPERTAQASAATAGGLHALRGPVPGHFATVGADLTRAHERPLSPVGAGKPELEGE